MTDRIKGAVIGGLLLLLACSLLANLFLFSGWQSEQGRAERAQAALTTANNSTETCNASIVGLESAAFRRGEDAQKSREQARKRASTLEQRAQAELSTPATVPGNSCKSAQDRVDRILRGRALRAAS